MSSHAITGVDLTRTDENVDEIATLHDEHGGAGGVLGVLAETNRQAHVTRVPGRAVEWGFRWADDDLASRRWWPQGITTSADADRSDLAGHRIVVTSAYSKTIAEENHGSRISIVDLDTLRYRNVLLVVPRYDGDRVHLDPLTVHAGGLVWCGPYLHIAGTRRGLVTCRVDDLLRVRSTVDTLGYEWVLPVRFAYDARAADEVEPLRYSFLSLDRSADPPELIAGEYGVDDMTTRLVHYPLDPATFHLSAHEDGVARPASSDSRGLAHMQGAAVVDGTYYVTTSRGRWRLGTVHVGRPGEFRAHPRSLPVGPEDVSYWPADDQLWSLSEYPGRRWVFCMDRAQFD